MHLKTPRERLNEIGKRMSDIFEQARLKAAFIKGMKKAQSIAFDVESKYSASNSTNDFIADERRYYRGMEKGAAEVVDKISAYVEELIENEAN